MNGSLNRLQSVVLPRDNAKLCINRESVDCFHGNSQSAWKVDPGCLWRSCSADEMQRVSDSMRPSSVHPDLQQCWKSLEHESAYCQNAPGIMKDLTVEQVKILLPLSAEKRIDFYPNDSMKTAVACRVGDLVVAVDPAMVKRQVPTDRVKCTVKFKGSPTTASPGTYFGLLSLDVADDGSPLQTVTEGVELPRHITVRNLLQLNDMEATTQRVFLCTADWLTSEFEPQFGNNLNFERPNYDQHVPIDFGFRVADRVVVHLDSMNWRRGVIKWLGRLKGADMAGVEFDSGIEGASCCFEGRKVFDGKEGCCRLVNTHQLQRESEFDARRGGPANAVNGLGPPPPGFDQRLDEASAMLASRGIQLGTQVFLSHLDVNAIVMWCGFLPDHDDLVVGVESNQADFQPGNGVLDSNEVLRIYPSADKYLLYTFLGLVEPAPSKDGQQRQSRESIDGAQFGNLSCDTIPGLVLPALRDRASWRGLIGRNRGVQGHHNSCYLDSTLFAMFATVDAFDVVLERNGQQKDIEREIRLCLKEGIVNCLRQHKYVRGDHVLRLRQHLDTLKIIPGMMNEEKDPEEFINLLLDHALHHDPFIKLSTGQSCHVLQLFLDRSNLPFEEEKAAPAAKSAQDGKRDSQVADTETLLHLSLIQSGIQFKKPPECLILQMPRSGKSYKLFHRILPVLELNISNLLPDTARSCCVCGSLATLECHQCFLKHDSGRDYTYCEKCFNSFTDHKKIKTHKGLKIEYPDDIRERYRNGQVVAEKTVMQLLAVVCIRTSHYVCFLRAEPDHWLFFDSMADREGVFDNGHNIPEVTEAPNVEAWLNKVKLESQGAAPNEHVTRLLEDCYLCFYGNPRVVPC